MDSPTNKVEAAPFFKPNSDKVDPATGLTAAEKQMCIDENNRRIIEEDKALEAKPNFPLVRLYNKNDELLFITKSPQIQQLLKRLWSADIDHATFVWYHTKLDQEEAKFIAVRAEEPIYNMHSA